MVHAAVPASGRLLRRQATYALVAPHVESVHPRLGQAGPSTRCPSSAAPSAPHVRHNTRRRGASASSTATVVQASLQTPEIEVEKTSWSSRRLYARVLIQAPAELVWACLTDYDGLGDFIPSLVENRCLQRKSDGCRLYQVGAQQLAMGVAFSAACTLEVTEHKGGAPSDLLDTTGADLSRLPVPRGYLTDKPAMDIEFNSVEGDFEVFKGLWRIQTAGPQQALLCYALYVQPQKWLPVKLIQGRITNQVVANLSCVQSHAESIMAAKRDGSKQPQLNQ